SRGGQRAANKSASTRPSCGACSNARDGSQFLDFLDREPAAGNDRRLRGGVSADGACVKTHTTAFAITRVEMNAVLDLRQRSSTCTRQIRTARKGRSPSDRRKAGSASG